MNPRENYQVWTGDREVISGSPASRPCGRSSGDHYVLWGFWILWPTHQGKGYDNNENCPREINYVPRVPGEGAYRAVMQINRVCLQYRLISSIASHLLWRPVVVKDHVDLLNLQYASSSQQRITRRYQGSQDNTLELVMTVFNSKGPARRRICQLSGK